MKTAVSLVIVTLFVAVGLGLYLSYHQINSHPYDPDTLKRLVSSGYTDGEIDPDSGELVVHTGSLLDKKPSIKVDRLWNFGTLQNGEVGSHTFKITNTGNAMLTVKIDETSCKCTAAEIGEGKIPPGESEDILVTWKTADYMGEYVQKVLLKTNDPDLALIELEVQGKVVADARALPAEMSFTGVTFSKSSTVSTQLYCYKTPPLKITDSSLLEPTTQANFTVELVPMTEETFVQEPEATGGYTINITTDERLPVGPFQQTLVLKTDSPLQPEIRIPIHGTVEGAITVAGPGWDSETDTWVMGVLDHGTSASRTLWLIDRSPKNKSSEENADTEISSDLESVDHVKFEIEEVVPDFVKVELKEPILLKSTGVVRTLLTASIPADAPVSNYWGYQPEQKGRIVLKTSAKESKSVLIYIRFVVKSIE